MFGSTSAILILASEGRDTGQYGRSRALTARPRSPSLDHPAPSTTCLGTVSLACVR